MGALWPEEEVESYVKAWYFILMVPNSPHEFFNKGATASDLDLRKESGSRD